MHDYKWFYTIANLESVITYKVNQYLTKTIIKRMHYIHKTKYIDILYL